MICHRRIQEYFFSDVYSTKAWGVIDVVLPPGPGSCHTLQMNGRCPMGIFKIIRYQSHAVEHRGKQEIIPMDESASFAGIALGRIFFRIVC